VGGRFEGRVALVTGAGSGIGLATARRLADEGAVVMAGIESDAQRSALGGCDPVVLDVRESDGWQRAIEHTEQVHGGLDVLVNIAGIHALGTAETTGRALWDEMLGINLTGTFLGCQAAIPALRRRGGGTIVNMASIAGIRGVANQVAYNTSKGGVVALTMALAADHVADRIRVNCVCPGAVSTGIIDRQVEAAADPAAFRAQIVARQPMRRLGEVEEVAAVIAFLASDEASFMTGVALPVDGGRAAR
jgi:3alpha(or 20beta)-hydroxysteroid dehydrogenase